MIWRLEKYIQSPDFGLVPPAKIINRVRFKPRVRLVKDRHRAGRVIDNTNDWMGSNVMVK